MRRNILTAITIVCMVSWAIWAGHWSESAQRCFAAGGTNFDWLGWSCYHTMRVTIKD
jgi:hypothetical protein